MQPLRGAVTNASQFPRVLAARCAPRSTSGRRGDRAAGRHRTRRRPDEAPAWSESSPPSILPADADLDRLAALLNASDAVTLLCGSGTQGAHDEVVALADTLGAPVVHALRGKQFVEWDNPFDVGMTGLIGFSSGYHAMESCDTLLMLGTDFPYRPFYPSNAKIAQIDWKARNSAIARRSRSASSAP